MSYVGISGVEDYLSKAMTGLQAAGHIIEDPAFTEVSGLIIRLHKANQLPGAGTTTKGVGLSAIVKPLKFYVYSQEHKWVLPALIAGVLLVPYLIGRSSRK